METGFNQLLSGLPHDLYHTLSHINCFSISFVTGLYICEDNDQAPERFRGLGVRIEDDVVIRDKGGPLILSCETPKTIADVEKACAQR